jgi:putative membrane protein
MMRVLILSGLAFMFLQLHLNGDLNKYINTKYSYLSVIAIVLLVLLLIFEIVRGFLEERAEKLANAAAACDHDHHEFHGHSHFEPSVWKRTLGSLILIFPVITGIFFPVETLDSSFVKAKGFSFPSMEEKLSNPGYHQFLKPDISIFYGEAGYQKLTQKDMSDIINLKEIVLNDKNYLRSLEVIYNNPASFLGKTIGFDGFVYKGDQVDENHYFVFRFGFIHCVADSGVYGMLVEFPKGTVLQDDQWVHVTGKLSSELYLPFKQTIPMLRADEWNDITEPSNPYVYRFF